MKPPVDEEAKACLRIPLRVIIPPLSYHKTNRKNYTTLQPNRNIPSNLFRKDAVAAVEHKDESMEGD